VFLITTLAAATRTLLPMVWASMAEGFSGENVVYLEIYLLLCLVVGGTSAVGYVLVSGLLCWRPSDFTCRRPLAWPIAVGLVTAVVSNTAARDVLTGILAPFLSIGQRSAWAGILVAMLTLVAKGIDTVIRVREQGSWRTWRAGDRGR